VNAVGASSDIAVADSFNWKLFLCLLLAWVVIYLCLFRGIQSSGKVNHKHMCVVAIRVYTNVMVHFLRAISRN